MEIISASWWMRYDGYSRKYYQRKGMRGVLVLMRHGESEWNAVGKWTGLTDIPLTEKGREEARRAAVVIKDIHFERAFCSKLARATQTVEEILTALGRQDIPVTYTNALNERDYGIYTGKNKWEVKKEIGEEQFEAIRRGYETPIPGGENLQQVCQRVHPYYTENILPLLVKGKHILVTAHNNSLRAMIKLVENIPDDKAAGIEMKTGEVLQYEIDETGKMVGKIKLVVNEEAGLQ